MIALLIGVVFVYLTPPFWGADERAHFSRAYQMSNGELIQHSVTLGGKTSTGGAMPESFAKLSSLVNADILDNPANAFRQVDSYEAYRNLSQNPASQEKKVANPYGAIIYPPVTYIAPALGMFVAHFFNPTVLDLLYVARLATLAAYVALAFISIWVLRKTSVKWILFLVALLPMSLYNASIVSADSILLGVSFVFLSLMYSMARRKHPVSNAEVLWLGVAAVIMTIIKPPYVVLVLPLIGLSFNNIKSNRLKYAVRAFIPTLSVLVAILCVIANRSVISLPPSPSINAGGQLHHILSNPLAYIYVLVNSITKLDWVPQVIGLFGTSFIFIPGIVFQILLISLALSVFITTRNEDDERKRILTGSLYMLAGLLVALIVVTTLYLTWTPVGDIEVQGIQGRYFLPVVAFILIGIRIALKQRLIVSERSLSVIYPAVIVFCLVCTQLWYYKILY